MRRFTKLAVSTLTVMLVAIATTFGQVPAEQEVIVIEGGPTNMGLLEQTINNDTDENGNRINPNRVYMLKKDQIYYQQSAINFGGDGDTDATLIIEGEEGGKKPLILVQPLDGGGAFQNVVNGSLTIKNIHWPVANLDGNATALFSVNGPDKTLRLEGVITDLANSGDVFVIRGITGQADVYIKDCYFRDNTQFGNSWNYSVFARGDNGEAIDTLWVENTTISNAGMPFFGKFNPVNFMYLNHNTIVNTTKYPIWFEQYKEAYITNNLFINANYEGECQSTWETQLSNSGPYGIININPINAEYWDTESGMVAPTTEEVVFLASNNLSYYSPFLDDYYNGALNPNGDKPGSMRAWGSVTEDMLPILVENVPVPLIGETAQGLIDANETYVALDNYDNDTDPEMVTKGMATQEVADEFIKFMRNNYGVAEESETYDKSMMYFGDGNSATFPGDETEEGAGITSITNFIEDFTYTSGLTSTIDGKPLGALTWWGTESLDSETNLANVKEYYADPENWTIPSSIRKADAIADFTVFPNPAKNTLRITSGQKLSTISVYDVTGRMVKDVTLSGEFTKTLDISELKTGVYFIKAVATDGALKTSKVVKR